MSTSVIDGIAGAVIDLALMRSIDVGLRLTITDAIDEFRLTIEGNTALLKDMLALCL